MKVRVFTALIMVLIGGLLLTLTGKAGLKRIESEVAFTAGNLVRLHVMANSDGPEDQRVKLSVRNRILEETEELLAVNTKEEAMVILADHRDYLAHTAENELRKQGFNYSVAVEMGEFEFPERSYEFGVLPAGSYQALRVILGEGKGRNWWCVLFPPVCHLSFEEKTEVSAEKLRLRWKALENLQAEQGALMEKAWSEWAKLFQLATIVIR